MKKIIVIFLSVCSSSLCGRRISPSFQQPVSFRMDNRKGSILDESGLAFYKGAADRAEAKDFDDKDWTVVSLPHGIEYLPTEGKPAAVSTIRVKPGIASISHRMQL